MSELATTLVIGILVAGGVYAFLEFWETLRASRDLSPKPVSGPESLVGRRVKAHGSFEPGQDRRRLYGRVLIDGEIWSAELKGRTEAPEIGELLEIVAIDASGLKVSVK